MAPNGSTKRLIVCCDGTWKGPEERDVTNVVKVARAIHPSGADGVPQLVFYDWGVGSENLGRKISGGVLGKGLDKNIRDAYRFLVHNYSPGDQIYLFGFSRGAYTARSTVGLVRNAGLLLKEHGDRIPEAYRHYRSRSKPDAKRAVDFRSRYSREVKIEFIGVWDTVGALGLPIRLFRGMNKKKYEFHDTELSRIMRHACHALAVDEKRKDFEPTLWADKPKPDQTVEQVWFAGAHSDVGGGYRETGLADIALGWMLKRAASHGLSLNRSYINRIGSPDPLGKLHNSLTGPFRLKGKKLRTIGKLSNKTESIAPSVHERIRGKPGYRPINLMGYLKLHSARVRPRAATRSKGREIHP